MMKQKLLIRIGIVIFLFVFYVIIQMKVYEHNMHTCHRNIEKVRVGQTIAKALDIMDEGLILRIREKEKCYHSDHKADFTIIYPYRHDADPTSSYPELCYDSKTSKVVSLDIGQIP